MLTNYISSDSKARHIWRLEGSWFILHSYAMTVGTRYGPNIPAADIQGNGRGWFLGLRPQNSLGGIRYGRIDSFLRKSFHSFLRRLRTSKKKSEVLTTSKNGLSEATTASEVQSDLRFGICGPNCICNHICLDSLGLFSLNFVRKKKKEHNSPLLELPAPPQLKKLTHEFISWIIWTDSLTALTQTGVSSS